MIRSELAEFSAFAIVAEGRSRSPAPTPRPTAAETGPQQENEKAECALTGGYKVTNASYPKQPLVPYRYHTSFFVSNREENLTNRINTVLDRHLRLRQPKQLRRAGNIEI
jgi:hypothetical protein